MSQKVPSPEALEITLGIGGDEIAHFLEWVDFSGNGVQPPIAPFTDPTNGLTFPNFDALTAKGGVNPLLQTNLIFPVPCEFIRPGLPHCAVIRPIKITAMDAINGFIQDGLFIGQSRGFLAQDYRFGEEGRRCLGPGRASDTARLRSKGDEITAGRKRPVSNPAGGSGEDAQAQRLRDRGNRRLSRRAWLSVRT